MAKRPVPPEGAPRRRATRDPEDVEDEEMLRNPREHPFPSFPPSQSNVARKRVEALSQIDFLAKSSVPVVPFKDMHLPKPPWGGTSQYVRHEYVPALDMLATHSSKEAEPPTLTNPPWLNIIPRAVCGCPQLGLPMQFEASAKERANTGRKQKKHAAAVAAALAEEAKGERISKMTGKQSTTPRFNNKKKDDFLIDLLGDPKLQEHIRKAVGNRAPNEHVVITLPRIGPRMFMVAPRKKVGSPTAFE